VYQCSDSDLIKGLPQEVCPDVTASKVILHYIIGLGTRRIMEILEPSQRFYVEFTT
jgi:hypothetical protein